MRAAANAHTSPTRAVSKEQKVRKAAPVPRAVAPVMAESLREESLWSDGSLGAGGGTEELIADGTKIA